MSLKDYSGASESIEGEEPAVLTPSRRLLGQANHSVRSGDLINMSCDRHHSDSRSPKEEEKGSRNAESLDH